MCYSNTGLYKIHKTIKNKILLIACKGVQIVQTWLYDCAADIFCELTKETSRWEGICTFSTVVDPTPLSVLFSLGIEQVQAQPHE